MKMNGKKGKIQKGLICANCHIAIKPENVPKPSAPTWCLDCFVKTSREVDAALDRGVKVEGFFETDVITEALKETK